MGISVQFLNHVNGSIDANPAINKMFSDFHEAKTQDKKSVIYEAAQPDEGDYHVGSK